MSQLLDFTPSPDKIRNAVQGMTVAAPQAEPGLFGKAWNSLKAVAEGVTRIPGGVADTLSDVAGGGDIDVTDEAALQALEERRTDQQAYLQRYEGQAFSGVAGAMESMPYSLATMGGSILGGVLAGPAGGMGAAGAVAARGTRTQFMQDMLDAAKQALGRMPTEDEWAAISRAYADDADAYALWEAVPEALTNSLFLKILGPVGKEAFASLGIKSALGRGAAELAATQLEEQTGETVTQWGQGGIETRAGLRAQAPTLGEAFGEQAPTTFWQTLLMHGGGKTARWGFDKLTGISGTRPDGKAGAAAGLRSLVEGRSEIDAMKPKAPGTDLVPVGQPYTVYDAEIVPPPADFMVTPGGRVAGRYAARPPQGAPIMADAGQAFLPDALSVGTGALPTTLPVSAPRIEATAAPALGKSPDESGLTAHEKGVTALPVSSRSILAEEDWERGKAGDMDAARRVVDGLWTPAKTEELKTRLVPDNPVVFVTVPSSSRTNAIPVALAERLSARLGGEAVDGGTLFDTQDTRQMKRIPKADRPFAGRRYVAAVDLAFLKGRQVVVVEDVLTTGASAHALVRALKDAGVDTQTVAGLMGDARLTPEPQVVNRLQAALKRSGSGIKGKELASVLSRGEALGIIEAANKTQGREEERHEFAQRIQRLFDDRTSRRVGRDNQRHGGGDAGRKGAGDERAASGIQAGSGVLQDARRAGSGAEEHRRAEGARPELSGPAPIMADALTEKTAAAPDRGKKPEKEGSPAAPQATEKTAARSEKKAPEPSKLRREEKRGEAGDKAPAREAFQESRVAEKEARAEKEALEKPEPSAPEHQAEVREKGREGKKSATPEKEEIPARTESGDARIEDLTERATFRRASDDTPVTVVEVEPGIVPEFAKVQDLVAWLKEYFAERKTITIKSTGKEVSFTNRGLRESAKRRGDAQRKAYAGLDRLVEEAVYDGFEEGDARHPHVAGQEVYYAAMRLGDKLYAVKFKLDLPLHEDSLHYKDHKVTEIEIAPVLSAAKLTDSDKSQPGASAIHTVNVGVLRGSVKPSRLENGTLSAIASGEFLPKTRRGLRPVKASAVRRVADSLGRKAARAAQTEVVQSFDELPARLREEYGDKARAVEGVYDPAAGKVWLVADNLFTLERAADVWAHEQIVHHGLRGLLGEDERKRLLNRLWLSLGGMGNEGIREIAERYGVNPRGDTAARQQVMEEYLAGMAEKKRGALLSPREESLWRRIVAAVREAWAKLVRVVGGRDTAMGKADVDRLLSALGRYVMIGRPEGVRGEDTAGAPAFASVGEDREAAGRAAWEQVRKDTEAWGRQLDEFMSGTGMRSLLTVCRTPDVLKKLGAPDLPMSMTGDNVGKVMSGKPDHNLPADLLKRLPAALAEPVMVFESATSPDSFVILTELKHEGRSVMAAVHLDTIRQRIRVNDIASAYKRGNEAWYLKQIEEGRLLYQDKPKSLAWARTNRLQLPKVRKLPARLSERRILTEKDVVKPVPPNTDKPLASLAGAADREAAGRAAWEQVRKDTEAWGRQLDAFSAGRGNKIRGLTVGETPDVLQRLGAKPLPMEMARHNLVKVLTKHGVPLEALRDLPQHLADPLMVFKSATMADAYVVLTEMERNGENLVAAIHFDVEAGRARINDIASIHDRSTVRDMGEKVPGWVWIKNQITAGNLRYYDKTRSSRWFRERAGLQLPSVVNRESYRGIKILTEKDVVKPVPPDTDKPLASLAGAADREAAGRAAWEQVRKDTEAWGRQLDGVRTGKASPRQVLTVGQTPGVLQKLGAPDLPMTMTQSVLHKIGEGGKHGLPDSLIRNLPASLAEPVMVFRSATQADSLVALLETIQEGMPVVAAVHLDVSRGSVHINEIASVYGKSNGGIGWVAGEIRAGRRVYADKTKIPAWLRGFSKDQGSRRMSGLQLPGAFVLPADPRGVKILTEKDVVKPVPPDTDKPLASLAGAADRVAEKIGKPKKRALSGISAGELADNPALAGVLEKIGVTRPTLAEKWANVKDTWKTTLEQGLFDRFASIKAYSETGYKMARMSTGLGSRLRAIMEFGAPVWRDDAMAVEGKGLQEIFDPVAGELDRFLHWMVGRRASRLMEEGRENLLTKRDIAALLGLAEGKTADGKARRAEYEKVFRELAAFKGKVLDFAQAGGIIDPVGRAVWENADYIPFYRVQERMDGVSTRGPRNGKGLTGQNAGIRELKGGMEKLGDPLENLLRNFAHLIDAAQKNKAALQVFADLHKAGMAEQLTSERTKAMVQEDSAVLADALEAENLLSGLSAEQKQSLLSVFAIRRDVDASRSKDGGVVYARYQGRPYLFKVTDPLLYRALTGMNDRGDNGAVMRFGRKIKRVLTTGVTIMPDFMVRNFLRDSVHSWVVEHKSGLKPLTGSLQGLRATLAMDEDTRQLFASGATFMGNGYRLGNDPEAGRLELERMLKKSRMDKEGFFKSLLDDPKKIASALTLAWDKYESLGGASENAVRHEIYARLRKQGYSHLDAGFAARDIMDFSMRGEFAFIRTLTDLVPFLGARLTGLHRLGQGALENPRAFAVKGGLVALAAVGLFLANLTRHKDEWDELEDWDKDSYFHFWIGGQHFRLPKPFEVGFLFGTIPERMAEQALTDAPSGVFWGRVFRGIADQLAMDPTPQAVKPILEDIANRDSFRGTPIVGQALAGRLPTEQHTARTTMSARLFADAMDALLSPVFGKSSDAGVDALRSPVRLEHLINGYFGGLGSTVLALSDRVIRWLRDDPALPSARGVEDWPLVGAFYRGDADTAGRTKFEGELYDAMREADALAASLKLLRETGDTEAEARLREEMGERGARMLRERKALNRLRRDFAKFNRMMDAVYRDRTMSSSQKRLRLDELQRKKNELARREWARRRVAVRGG